VRDVHLFHPLPQLKTSSSELLRLLLSCQHRVELSDGKDDRTSQNGVLSLRKLDKNVQRWLCRELSWDSGGEAGCHSEKGGRGRNQMSATLARAQQSAGIVLFQQPLRTASYP
jgi:hypothetical protein